MGSLNPNDTGRTSSLGGVRLDAILGRRLHPGRDFELIELLLDPQRRLARELAFELRSREEFWERSFAELFPGSDSVSQSTPVEGCSIRTQNVLTRANLKTW